MNGDAGFTLIETLCAFAILAVVLTVLYAASGTVLQGLKATEDRETVVLLARSKLEELAALPGPLPQIEEGHFQGTEIDWRVDAARSGIENPGTRATLQDVKLTLHWPARSGNETLVLATRHLAVVSP